MHKRALSVFMAGVLACALCPGIASAATLEAGSSASLDTQAAKSEVYVITKVERDGNGITSALFGGTFKYAKNGLVTSVAVNDGAPVKYTYKNANIAQMKQGTSKTVVSTTSHGTLKKAVWTMPNSSTKSITDTFTSDNGRITSCTETLVPMPNMGDGCTNKSTFTYTDGKISKETLKGTWVNTTYAYKYDKHDNLSAASMKNAYMDKAQVMPIKNTYDKEGKLKQRSFQDQYSSEPTTLTYKYKKIAVDKKLAKKVKAQQWALVNGNLNFAIGVGQGTNLMY